MNKAELLLTLVQELLSEIQDAVENGLSDEEDNDDSEENPPEEDDHSEEESEPAPGMSHVQQHYLKQSP